MKYLDLFNPIIKGSHGFTDEAIYSSIKNGDKILPLYGGNSQHRYTERYVSNKTVTVDGKEARIFKGEGVVISLDGSAGCMTYKSGEEFALNHHAGFMTLNETGKKKVNLRFFSIFMQNHYKSLSVSDGSKTLSLQQIYSEDLVLPEKEMQDKIMASMNILLKKIEQLDVIYNKLSSTVSKHLSIQYQSYQARNQKANDIFDYVSGNSGLTEEFLYNNIGLKGKRYKILSSATIEDNLLGEIPMCKINNRKLKVFSTNKEGLLVIRKGKAGNTVYLKAGDYTLNDDAYIIFKKDSCPFRISLKWLSIQYRKDFLDYASSSDNGTWNMTGFFNNVLFDIPSYDEQIKLVSLYEKAEDILARIDYVYLRFHILLSKEIS